MTPSERQGRADLAGSTSSDGTSSETPTSSADYPAATSKDNRVEKVYFRDRVRGELFTSGEGVRFTDLGIWRQWGVELIFVPFSNIAWIEFRTKTSIGTLKKRSRVALA